MNLQIKVNIIFFARCCLFIWFILFCCQSDLFGQDSIIINSNNINSIQDSIPPLLNDSIPTPQDSFFIPSFSDTLSIKYSEDTLNAEVDYNATDSIIYDIANKRIHLYGNANVTYTSIDLKADYIAFDWETNIVTAEGLPDSTGKMAGFPEFSDGSQSFTAKRMRYNFKSQKGIVYDVTTQQNDVYVLGGQSKFVSDTQKDSLEQGNDVVYSQDAIFTTCNHPIPHFGIRSRKQKVVPNKLVIVGASNLEIMGVPTPLWLPFGFFPISSGRSTGLIFPRDYEYSPQLGFGLREIGWFFPLGDHVNLSVTGDIYLRGTWGLNARSNYRKRYKYNGRFELGYFNRRVETNEGVIVPDQSFSLRWNHQQDRSAHPNQTFGGSINLQTNNYQSIVYNDASSVLTNQLSSNLTYSKNWPNAPVSLSASFNHNQNSQTGNVSISFPNVQFKTQTLYPLRSSKSRAKSNPLTDLAVRYTNDIKNQFDATDTTLFDRSTLENARFGVRHNVNAGTSIKLFQYFNLNPSFNYREVWYLNTIRRDLVTEDSEISVDTIFNADRTAFRLDTTITSESEQIERRVNGFDRFYQMSSSISLNTQIFGTVYFKKGFLRGLRHVIKPTIGLSFSPDYLNPDLGWFDEVQSATNPDLFSRYSIFDGGIFGTPSASGKQMALTYSLNNIFEAKIFSKKDSTTRNVKLFNNISFSGNYNFAADSLKWSPVNASGTARFFKGATTLSLRAVFDPYTVDDNGRRINQTFWRSNGKFLRFDNARATLSTRLTIGKIRAIFQGKEEEYVEEIEEPIGDGRNRGREAVNRREIGSRDPIDETDFLSLFENFSINHNIAFTYDQPFPGLDTFFISTNSIDIQGRINLTDNWNVRIGRIGYDFVRKNITFPSVGFSRDLHCWEMGMDWQPTRGTYRFFIQVKPGTLDFIKIPYQRNNVDALNAFN